MNNEELTLESVNKELERLENEKEYVLDRISNILSLVLPKSQNVDSLQFLPR